MIKTYSYDDDLTEVFVGKRIIKAELDVPEPEGIKRDRWGMSLGTSPLGRLTLDDGTEVYVAGNDGGCSCGAGDYQLTRVATVDNIITAVAVIDKSTGDFNYDSARPENGSYALYVITAAEELNVAEFEGDDGNGYYGSGFHIGVVGVEQ
jgi:hypothetical protein